MTRDNNNKLRAVFLAALMFLWLFAGTVALAGTAAAATNAGFTATPDTAGDSATLDATITAEGIADEDFTEVRVDFSGASGFDNGFASAIGTGDVDVTVGGNAATIDSVEVSNNGATLDVTLSGLQSPTAGEDIVVTVSNNWQNPDSAADYTGEIVLDPGTDESPNDRDTGTLSIIESSTVVDDEQVNETKDTFFDASYFQGQAVFVENFAQDTTGIDAGEQLQIRRITDRNNNGVATSTALATEPTVRQDGALVVRTARLSSGDYVVRDPGEGFVNAPGMNLQGLDSASEFEVVIQDLDASFDESEVAEDDTSEFTLDSNRGGYNVEISDLNENANVSNIQEIFGDLSDDTTVVDASDDDATVRFNDVSDFEQFDATFQGVEEDDYNFAFNVTDTTAQDTAAIRVFGAGVVNSGASISTTTVESNEVGDIVEVEVDFDEDIDDLDQEQVLRTVVTFGGTDANFIEAVEVVDEDRDGTATFTVNTYLMGTTDPGAATEPGVFDVDRNDNEYTIYELSGDSVVDEPNDDDPADEIDVQRLTEESFGGDQTQAFSVSNQLGTPVDPDSYTIRAHEPVTDVDGNLQHEEIVTTRRTREGDSVVFRLGFPQETDSADLTLNERQLNNINTSVAPSGETLNDLADIEGSDAITASSDVAEEDQLLIEIDAGGLGGQIEAARQSDELDSELDAFLGADGLYFYVEEQSTPANEDRIYLDLEDSGVTFIDNNATDTYYMVVDTGAAEGVEGQQLRRGEYEANLVSVGGPFSDFIEEGDAPDIQDVDFNELFPTHGFNHHANASFDPYQGQQEQQDINENFTLVNRQASFNRVGPDGNLRIVNYDAGTTISGDTTVAPGSTIHVRLRNQSADGFTVENRNVVVTDDQRWGFQTQTDGELTGVRTDPPTRFRASILESGQSIVVDRQADIDGTVPGLVLGAATVDFDDQSYDGRADSLVVNRTFLPQGGFVTIHDATLLDGAVFDSVRGSSQYLPPGTHHNVSVGLEDPITETGTFIPMAHQDTDEDQLYRFVETEGAEDGPYTEIQSEQAPAVVDDGTVTIVTPTPTPTPTPTATPTPEPMTPTPEPSTPTATDTPEPSSPTPTASPTPTPDDDQPGFGAVIALIALLAAALLAARRDAFGFDD